jgi:tetratricopeptide (TPR) repeat protein
LTGDEAAYQHTCALLLEAYNGQTKPSGFFVARSCIMGPKAVNDLSLAEKAGAQELRGQRTGWVLNASAGLHYRAGRYQQATELLHQSLHDNPNWDGNVVSWLWLALAYHQLGKDSAARQWLGKATKWLDSYSQRPPAPSSSLNLHEWLEANVLRREAEALILGKKDGVKK